MYDYVIGISLIVLSLLIGLWVEYWHLRDERKQLREVKERILEGARQLEEIHKIYKLELGARGCEMPKSVWVCYTCESREHNPYVCKIFSTEEKAREWVKKSEEIDLNDTIFDPGCYRFTFFYGECVVDDDVKVCCSVHQPKELGTRSER